MHHGHRLGQLIGKCVGRDKRTGRFVSLTKERVVLGGYTDVEPVEFERRPNPRKAPAVAARPVLGLTLAVITATAPKAAAAAVIAAMLLPVAAKAARSVAGYIDREILQQWDLALALTVFGRRWCGWPSVTLGARGARSP